MPTTFEPIHSTTIVNPAPSFEWTNISSNFTDLVISIHARTSTGGGNSDCYMTFNGDAGQNYSRTWTAISNATGFNHPFGGALISYAPGNGAASGLFSNDIVHIQNYSNNTTHKPYFLFFGTGTGAAWTIGQWFNPTPQAITSIKIFTLDGSNFLANSVFSLYGIAAA